MKTSRRRVRAGSDATLPSSQAGLQTGRRRIGGRAQGGDGQAIMRCLVGAGGTRRLCM